MDSDTKMFCAIVVGIVFVLCFLTFQIQQTNRAFVAQGFSYSPVSATTYVTSWHK